MKTKLFRCVVLSVALVATVALIGENRKSGLIVHEWGTFTSLQGSDGVPLKWNSLQVSALPGFVYAWSSPGFDRRPISPLSGSVFSKVGMPPTLQRMETPVIYFYSDRETKVDVNVRFPDGLVTEWFPQAAKIGPSSVPPSSTIVAVDNYLARTGISKDHPAAWLFDTASVKDSVVSWPGVKVFPFRPGESPSALLKAGSGSHYFAARETDSAELLVEASYKTNHTSEREKFLFYRGVGNFSTPLTVRMQSDAAVTIANTGTEPLRHLFILTLSKGTGGLVEVESLAAHSERTVPLAGNTYLLPAKELAAQISTKMAAALTKEGLYPREATAMVNTWKDSWFAEEGARVLYILPRTWTDKTLPMQLKPAPAELVRVMVGRAEVLSSSVERRILTERVDPKSGIYVASPTVKSLGRFGSAAEQRALALAKQQ